MKTTKPPKSQPRIDLSPETVAVLAKHRKAALPAGRIASPAFHDTGGGLLRLPNLAKNRFKPIMARAKQPSVGLYTLRHTCATLLLLADQPAKVVSERLGHSSIALTLDTYLHVLPSMQKRAAGRMNAIGYKLGYKAVLGHRGESTQPIIGFYIRACS